MVEQTMIREDRIFISRDHKDALRVAATLAGLTHPEEVLESVLAEWLSRNAPLSTYLTERARLRDAADTEARRLAGL